MTFTHTYIQMMSQSPVQKEWKPKMGDWALYPDGKHRTIWQEVVPFKRIWLPLEGDWWEMIDWKGQYQLNLFKAGETKFCLAVEKRIPELGINFGETLYWIHEETMVELLSAFVHRERWGVKWDGEEWRKG